MARSIIGRERVVLVEDGIAFRRQRIANGSGVTVTDVNHISSGAFAGSITAALFLRRFISAAKAWAHFDVFAWTPTAKPGRPFGGEPQVARLVFELLERRYGG